MPPLALFNRNNTNTEEEGRLEKKDKATMFDVVV